MRALPSLNEGSRPPHALHTRSRHGACTNASDMSLDLEIVGQKTTEIATNCYLGGAVDDEAYAECAAEGLIDETNISEGCADCFVQNAVCAKNNCLVPCLSDPVACEECRIANGCTAAFFECAGDIPGAP